MQQNAKREFMLRVFKLEFPRLTMLPKRLPLEPHVRRHTSLSTLRLQRLPVDTAPLASSAPRGAGRIAAEKSHGSNGAVTGASLGRKAERGHPGRIADDGMLWISRR